MAPINPIVVQSLACLGDPGKSGNGFMFPIIKVAPRIEDSPIVAHVKFPACPVVVASPLWVVCMYTCCVGSHTDYSTVYLVCSSWWVCWTTAN